MVAAKFGPGISNRLIDGVLTKFEDDGHHHGEFHR